MEQDLSFAAYLPRRKSYSETGIALRAAVKLMPPEVRTVKEVYAWLAAQGHSQIMLETCKVAAHDYRDWLRVRQRGV